MRSAALTMLPVTHLSTLVTICLYDMKSVVSVSSIPLSMPTSVALPYLKVSLTGRHQQSPNLSPLVTA